jgi:hypothetical protein
LLYGASEDTRRTGQLCGSRGRAQRRPSNGSVGVLLGVAVGGLRSALGHAVDQPGADGVELGELVELGGDVVGDLDGRQFGRGRAGAPGGDGDRCVDAVQRELGDGFVAVGAEDDADALAVVAEAELLVDGVEVEVHLGYVLGLELADLELDDHEAP